jgi:hypothetical protein
MKKQRFFISSQWEEIRTILRICHEMAKFFVSRKIADFVGMPLRGISPLWGELAQLCKCLLRRHEKATLFH